MEITFPTFPKNGSRITLTNEPIDIPAYNQVRFKAGKAMKDAVKK